MTTKNGLVILIIIGFLALGLFIFYQQNQSDNSGLNTQSPLLQGERVTYTCADDRAFEVVYPPVGEHEGLVTVIVAEGLSYTLERVATSTGVRYANNNDDVVFTLINNLATLERRGAPSYEGCGQGSQMVQ